MVLTSKASTSKSELFEGVLGWSEGDVGASLMNWMASLSPCQVRACRPSLVDVSKQTLIVPDKRLASDLKSAGGD